MLKTIFITALALLSFASVASAQSTQGDADLSAKAFDQVLIDCAKYTDQITGNAYTDAENAAKYGLADQSPCSLKSSQGKDYKSFYLLSHIKSQLLKRLSDGPASQAELVIVKDLIDLSNDEYKNYRFSYDYKELTYEIKSVNSNKSINYPCFIVKARTYSDCLIEYKNINENKLIEFININNLSQSENPEYLTNVKTALKYNVYSTALAQIKNLSVNAPQAEKIYQTSKDQLERWDAYHFGGGSLRTQLPWELLLNGAIYKAKQNQFDKDNREAGNPIAPLLPPQNAWVLFHPSIGVASFDKSGKSSGIVGVVEVLGYTCWDYDSENKGKRKNEKGISLVAVYAPSDDADDWAPGVLVRTPWQQVNLVYSQRDTSKGKESIIAFSVDVSKFLKTPSDSFLKKAFGLQY